MTERVTIAVDFKTLAQSEIDKMLSTYVEVAYLYTNVQSGDVVASTDPDWAEGESELWHKEPLHKRDASRQVLKHYFASSSEGCWEYPTADLAKKAAETMLAAYKAEPVIRFSIEDIKWGAVYGQVRFTNGDYTL